MPSNSGDGGGVSGIRIEVDPQVLIRAGQSMSSLGKQLDMLMGALGPMLSSGIASGIDLAGLAMALEYGDLTQKFSDTLAGGANTLKAVGIKLQASGHNYANADAVSTIGGGGPTGSVDGEFEETTPVDARDSPSLSVVPPPPSWFLVASFLGPTAWPSGNPSMLRLTAAQWKNLASGFSTLSEQVSASRTAVSTQKIPEASQIAQAHADLADGVADLADQATQIATTLETFADNVQDTQDAIRRLLDRVSSIDGIVDTVKGIFTGDALDIVKEVVEDIRTLLGNFQRQVKAVGGLLEALKEALNDTVTKFQKWADKNLRELLGDQVGGAISDIIKFQTDLTTGVLSGVINTVAGTVAFADLDTWKGLGETALAVVKDPSLIDDIGIAAGKEFLAWDQLTGDNPGRGIGEAGFNIAGLFVGGPLSKGGTVAKGVNKVRRAFDRADSPSVDLPGRHGLDGDLTTTGSRVPEVPEIRQGGIPDSVVNPMPPNRIDAPSSPNGLEAPVRPPDPPGPTTNNPGGGARPSGGGDGPPPDSPHRPVGPTDPGPTHSDAAPPHTPSTPESSHSGSSSVGEPPAPNYAPNAADHVPQHAADSSSPHDLRDTDSSPNERTPTANHEQGSPDSHIRSDTAHSNADTTSHAPDRHVNDHPANGNHRDTGIHDRNSQGYQPDTTRADTFVSVADDIRSTDYAKHDTSTQPPHSHPSAGDSARDHDNAAIAPPVGTGGPISSHSPGVTHTAADSQTSGRAHTPEPSTRMSDARSPESRNPQPSTSLDSPRIQSAGASAAHGHSPSAPVSSAAASPTAGPPPAQAAHGSPESRTPRTDADMREGSPPSAVHKTNDGSRSAVRDDRTVGRVEPGADQHPGSGIADDKPKDSPGHAGNPADSRSFGPHELNALEDPAHQAAVENALRDSNGNYIVHADPRTNDYGRLINDGGPTVDGRSNNCLDCSLSALASFRGEPTVSVPRYPDELPDGTIDRVTGEASGLRRAENWLGRGLLEFPGLEVAEQFNALHRYIDDLGPGSAALVVNDWHAVDLKTGDLLYNTDGSPVSDGSHATVVVYPKGADGPVWWDPQLGVTSDRPPSWMVDRSSHVSFTPNQPSQGAHHGGAENQGTSTGISGTDVADRDLRSPAVRERMGVHEGSHPGADQFRSGDRSGPAGDRFGDRENLSVPELVNRDGGGSTYDVQAHRDQPGGEANISPSVGDHGAPNQGGPGNDRVSTDGEIADGPARTDTGASADDRQENSHLSPDGPAVERGDGPREVGQSPEPRGVAGNGHESPVTPGKSGASSGHAPGVHPSDDAGDARPESNQTRQQQESEVPDSRSSADASDQDDNAQLPGSELSHAGNDSPPSDVPDDPRSESDDSADYGHSDVLEQEIRDMSPWERERVERAISPDKLIRSLIDGGCPPEMAASAASSPYAGLTPQELLARHWNPETHTWNWPPHDGFKDGLWTTTDHIPEGQNLDRVGLINDKVGDFMGVEGDSYPARALAPGTSGEYNVFRGTGATVPPGWEVRYGDVAQAFDQPGGATQWVVVDEFGDIIKIHTLVEEGIIEPVSGPYFDKWVESQNRNEG
ncbi:toxin glutamine deamidase domain-containing protein [Mycolicibacterium goodii]|uniref:Glycohydrolase toxin TNT-related protein n=1 Tax=Mycolicibacterium goodii TaxID=134601 RepID=A0ABS6HN82_MYCGD|nr:toxin glutamine deamidase domain-containing protein [Mycolicibacterium goodii]MBU8823149.1 glycohydrolase toxin TNT-related protein [Mycolicibacterium goodii]MBU8837410.1 glycohydrolase toxin TNT-related protein [Mycolicibacterium goodii]